MTRHNLNRLSYFVAIVEEKTITAAAQRLGLSKAVVSKHLQLLEEELGISLLMRNTRHIHPTEAGDEFYLRSKAVLIQAAEAFESVLEKGQKPTGLIRLTAPVDFGVFRLSALINNFTQAYPDVEIDLQLGDEQIDIVEQRIDIAFRIGWLKDSSNFSRKLSDFREVTVCCAETAGKWSIKSPDELSSMPFIAYRGISEDSRVFSIKGKHRTIELHSRAKFNVTSAIREAVLSGNCFAILPDFTVQHDVKEKTLVELVPQWCLRKGGIYMVSPPSRLRTQAVRLFMDWVTMELKGDCEHA